MEVEAWMYYSCQSAVSSCPYKANVSAECSSEHLRRWMHMSKLQGIEALVWARMEKSGCLAKALQKDFDLDISGEWARAIPASSGFGQAKDIVKKSIKPQVFNGFSELPLLASSGRQKANRYCPKNAKPGFFSNLKKTLGFDEVQLWGKFQDSVCSSNFLPPLWKVCWSLWWFWKPSSEGSRLQCHETGSNLSFVSLPTFSSVCSLDLGLPGQVPTWRRAQTFLIQFFLVEPLCLCPTSQHFQNAPVPAPLEGCCPLSASVMSNSTVQDVPWAWELFLHVHLGSCVT